MRYVPNITNIKIELARNGLSITALAKTIGYDISYINLVVNGKRNPSPKTASVIAKTLGVEIEHLFTITHKEVEA
ncbi:helix-turn-helix transcriptional regulator [Macrococcoides caseolyticum]|uniref:helix-turn-helix transcriptional regulator n=1 Tax=Macrococcoides caseolyticum TaxID=69966 RepID=UPI000C344B02|nr:helix-turn-helix transcriptional regulator [Macrococcus caseolyticus]PKE12695.1 XRE family transcriptional regulator [Macrococcus caseolyticus]PKE48840.1 XRE family transcriptional regulator [Macrococcus caseolyticus]PKF05835.1 XRE family transcriptional regulator [Macrococcus caseolyticus]PKF15804.1 XRE family transcriptional regulator [Macrococcus caseolyticus]